MKSPATEGDPLRTSRTHATKLPFDAFHAFDATDEFDAIDAFDAYDAFYAFDACQ